MFPRSDCLIFLFLLAASPVAIYAQSIDSVPRAEQELRDIANSKLTSYNDDDPRLKTAYAALFLQRYDSPAVWQASISSDLQRRGDKAIPILLELFEENPEGSFREELLFGLENYPSLKVVPILERVRRLVNDEGVNMSRRTNAAVCVFLSKVGTVKDFEILRKIAARDPDGEMGWTASRYLLIMEKRINGGNLTEPTSNSEKLRDASSLGEVAQSHSSRSGEPNLEKQAATSVAQHKFSLNGLLIPCLLFAASISILWFIFKRRS